MADGDHGMQLVGEVVDDPRLFAATVGANGAASGLPVRDDAKDNVFALPSPGYEAGHAASLQPTSPVSGTVPPMAAASASRNEPVTVIVSFATVIMTSPL